MKDTNNLEEKHSEVATQSEGSRDKLIQVYLSPELVTKFTDIQNWYRSPSITHTVRLMIEDMWNIKNLEEGK